MFENELAELMNKPDQHNVQNENNRNVQHVYNKVKHDNDNPLKIGKNEDSEENRTQYQDSEEKMQLFKKILKMKLVQPIVNPT